MRSTARLVSIGVLALLTVGAVPDDGAESWWSLRPIRPTPVPVVAGETWVRTPVDAFVLAKLKEHNLTPSPEADRRTLIRRLYFDLSGLPPTPLEIDEFAADSSPDAYEKVVDRLLASPHYGERWARHWMDVVHFAETHGHDQDRVRPNAWRYRDYLVQSFNADVPYARFAQEQVAADVLFPNEPTLTPALGMLAAGPWDESSLRDIREDSIDRQVGYYLDRDDMLTTVASSFLSMTVHCARCHDHKFDPIPQEDYYRMQAVFAGVGRGDVTYDADVSLGKRRREFRHTLMEIERRTPAILARIGSADFRRDLADWESKHTADAVHWAPLEISEATSAGGATLTKLPDHSIRSEGVRPDRDTYVVTVRTNLPKITAVRVELLTDDTLPKNGPGRQDNGNMHLSEFRVERSGNRSTVATAAPISDYDQPGWTIRHAVDGDVTTAWGIYPQVGRMHQAVFPFAQPLDCGHDNQLTIRLDQLHGGGHLIGRFRLTATAAVAPGRIPVLPDLVTEALATPADKRSTAQWEALGLHVLREKVSADMNALPKPAVVYAAASDFITDGGHKPLAEPRPVHLLKRGEIRRPGRSAVPGALSCVDAGSNPFDLPANHTEGERRAALARWITHVDNPLTSRSIVNRVWHYHFGRGIVDTPNDFGQMGGRPSHPELLDWLSRWFRDDANGSLKKLHRLLMTSSVYRQGSQASTQALAIDADNRFLWRMPRSRLDAEQVRDAVLLISGRLDRRMAGPSDQQFAMKPGIHVTPVVEYGKFDWSQAGGHRRSVYRFIFRTLPDPLVDCLDGADASQWTPARSASVTALQSLSLFNSDFMLAQCNAFADALARQFPDDAARNAEACRRVWGRAITEEESAAFAKHAQTYGLPSLCRVLFNSNEFLFLD